MAMFERLRDATRTTNTIEEIRPPEPSRPASDLHGANRAPVSEPAAPPGKKASAAPQPPAYMNEPEAIARAYYVENRGRERRYYEDYQRKNLAIQADDGTIKSKREDLNTIRAMLTMAESRGWSDLKVNGTADFKREAWIEAEARGLKAQGYKASDLDRQEAGRRRAERGLAPITAPASNANEVRQAGTLAAGPTAAPPREPPAPVQPSKGDQASVAQDASAPKQPASRQPAQGNDAPNAAAPTPAPGHDITAKKYRDATTLALDTRRYVVEVVGGAVRDNGAGPGGKDAVKQTEAHARQELDKIWKNTELAYSLKAQGLTSKAMDADLIERRFDRIQTALNASRADVTKWRSDQVRTETETARASQQTAPGGAAKPSAAARKAEPSAPPRHEAAAPLDHRKALREATSELSPDGRLMLAAMSEKIDRQMNKLNNAAKLEIKAYAATEMAKKEKAEGPVVLSPELRKAATASAPEQAKQVSAPAPAQPVARQVDFEQPKRSRAR